MGAGRLILIDTHVLLWMTSAPDRLGVEAKVLIERMAAENAVRISAISGWELAMLASKQRIVLGMPVSRWFAQTIERSGVQAVDIGLAPAIDAGTLEDELHGDPCDRLLIATARHLDCPLVTVDKAILSYGERGHLRVIDGRK